MVYNQHKSSRVNHGYQPCFIPLTAPYVRFSYTAPVLRYRGDLGKDSGGDTRDVKQAQFIM